MFVPQIHQVVCSCWHPLTLLPGLETLYTGFVKSAHWYFCDICEVRNCFFAGQGEVKEVVIEGEKKEAWLPRVILVLMLLS